MAQTMPKSATYFFSWLKASWVRAPSKYAAPAGVSLVFMMSFFLHLVVVSTLRSASVRRYGPGRTGEWGQPHLRIQYGDGKVFPGAFNLGGRPRHHAFNWSEPWT
ncbi:hypothetical protein GCM10010276_12380 [Streptomyces longisporus]|uniref:Uncharacterized protein n=1 Tax=Streptomyces longisporus TaxID=1948 RepID=A0ABN3L798_STRLO